MRHLSHKLGLLAARCAAHRLQSAFGFDRAPGAQVAQWQTHDLGPLRPLPTAGATSATRSRNAVRSARSRSGGTPCVRHLSTAWRDTPMAVATALSPPSLSISSTAAWLVARSIPGLNHSCHSASTNPLNECHHSPQNAEETAPMNAVGYSGRLRLAIDDAQVTVREPLVRPAVGRGQHPLDHRHRPADVRHPLAGHAGSLSLDERRVDVLRRQPDDARQITGAHRLVLRQGAQDAAHRRPPIRRTTDRLITVLGAAPACA